MVHLIVNGTKIDTTEKHPFWVIGKGWVKAGDLKAGNKVSLKTGEIGNVDSVEIEELDKPVKVYNFEVEDWHTYFVSDIGVLVHNKCWVGAEGAGNTNSRVALPGDTDFVGPIKSGSWKLTPTGEGAHLIERSNVRGRSQLSIYDKADTPRYYPYGSSESAGQAHIRLHESTRNQGIKLRGGNPGMSDVELLSNYERAYNNPSLSGIRGDLRTPDSSNVVITNVTPGEAYDALRRWGNTL